jgi:hypothetical protein
MGASPGHDLGRFAEPAMLVLVSLTDGPKHGYAITGSAAVSEQLERMERFVRVGRLRARRVAE